MGKSKIQLRKPKFGTNTYTQQKRLEKWRANVKDVPKDEIEIDYGSQKVTLSKREIGRIGREAYLNRERYKSMHLDGVGQLIHAMKDAGVKKRNITTGDSNAITSVHNMLHSHEISLNAAYNGRFEIKPRRGQAPDVFTHKMLRKRRLWAKQIKSRKPYV